LLDFLDSGEGARRTPESVTLKSGLEVLAPNKSVGKHNTGQHEELLVVLEGQVK
jgi:hypothetical protein